MLSWSNYWKSDPSLFHVIMKYSTAYVAARIRQFNLVKEGDRVLDFGCGPGYLAGSFSNSAVEYEGVDISATYIETAIQNYQDFPNLSFYTLASADQSIILKEGQLKFSDYQVILIISVIQYFEDHSKLEALLQECKKVLHPHGHIILADVIDEGSSDLWDLFSVMMNSLRKGYFLQFCRFIIQARFSGYNTLRHQNRLLNIKESELKKILDKLGLKSRLLPSLSLQKSRKNYLIQYQ